MTQINDLRTAARLSVAPMMDWTDSRCRVIHRALSRHALLYTEMVTAPAIVRGDAERLLAYDPVEHPVALQLGGSDPRELAEAARIGAGYGYDEINLNCGCPSDRVQSGTFGAVLMKDPARVADCVGAMAEAQGVEVTVKCRIGVDDQEPREVLPRFLEAIAGAGCRRVMIHARKAWLKGLSPKENRDIPPLDYALALEMKRAFPALHISLNGGIATLDEAAAHLEAGFDGVMIGRAAYHNPWDLLGRADSRIYGAPDRHASAEAAVEALLPWIEQELTRGARLNQITRHMLGLFTGRPGARQWRRTLSEEGNLPGAGPDVVLRALGGVVKSAA